MSVRVLPRQEPQQATPADFERLLSRREAAEYLSVSVSTLERWHLEGTGPTLIKLNRRRTAYRPADLRSFVEACARCGGRDAGPPLPAPDRPSRAPPVSRSPKRRWSREPALPA
jgi:hypothetical protein